SARHPLYFRLTAELSFGADFARHARHLRGKGVQLVDHRVDSVLELQNFASHVHRDLSRQVAISDSGGYSGEVPDLSRQVPGHRVDAVGEVLPHATDSLDFGLATQFTFRSDLAGNTRDFRRKGVQLVDHRVDRILQLQDFALHVHCDLSRQVTVS